jgi:hypothetical protein
MQFRQSTAAFPMMVTLGEKNPHFGLNRFNNALRFIPSDEEKFTLSGGKQRLLYKGRKRSHRFTILGDTAFEYDCILEKPPSTNVISLLMEGAEHFDFFRQPDFIKEPLLQGSYAVYKKETLLGEGTGKLCHIHRPEIIDARGRRCWGSLAAIGNELRITIPEQWLGEAAYPVIVDPFLGTSTVGSMDEFELVPEELETLLFECSMPVNRFLVPETINGTYTAFFYADKDDSDCGCRPILYTDNGDKPQERKSREEQFISLRVPNSSYGTWCSGNFKSDGIIESGSSIWFGAFVEYMWFPRFDFGAKCYNAFWDDNDSIPIAYPINNITGYEDFKLSMFFYYSASHDHVRTITQGVSIIDRQKRAGNYKRHLEQTVNILTLFASFQTFFFNIQEIVQGMDTRNITAVYLRPLKETPTIDGNVRHGGNYFRHFSDNAKIKSNTIAGYVYLAKIADTVRTTGKVFRGLFLLVRILTKAFVRDYLLRRFLISREELNLKSIICREVVLDSKIN